ncbi:hypothetical protein A6723_000035 [Pseudomonas sp. AU11447]|uniref:hypothetical protein n=1 Tax=unclassified Pseudomonas TaxID=196821 RepID=UPI0006D46900|nr:MULTISPECIES: hypothetical protein [unclassified Pseudomonas]OBY88837.1 hypothetical protein A6723_000035 [Pseudomonas sp. AU11447]
MSQFDLSTVKKVRNGSSNDLESVNAHLADGWVLVSTADGRDESGYPLSVYTLGWTKDEEPKPVYEY